MNQRVTVSMPYYGCADTVARAVTGVLRQTHRQLTLIVINDGQDPTTAWRPLANIRDTRLIRFDLPENQGRYYADAVTLAACTTPWWAPHDADDHSDPHRYATMLKAARHHPGAGAVFDPFVWHRPNRPDRVQAPDLTKARSRTLGHWTHWAALYRPEAVRAAGGLDGSRRAGWDTLLTQLLALTTPVATVDEPMYHYHQRPGSLTTSTDTGMRTVYRRRARAQYQRILTAAHRNPSRIGELTAMPAHVQASVDVDAERLRRLLKDRGMG